MGKNAISAWRVEDRPREKLMSWGLGAVTETELLAMVLGSGTRDCSAVKLAQNLIFRFGSLWQLARAEVEDLMSVEGIGKARATKLVATFELGRRRVSSEMRRQVFSGPQQIANYVIPKITDLQHEVVYIIFLNTGNVLLGEMTLSVGKVDAAFVDIPRIMKKALNLKANRIVMAHNHPSGILKASNADILVTKKVAAAAELLGLELLDHIVVASHHYVSLNENGIIGMKNQASTSSKKVSRKSSHFS